MQNSQPQPSRDHDLSVPSLSWGILLISVLSLYLELLFIRWIGTEIRIFAYLQNTILMVCFLGLGLGMFTSSKPIHIRQSLILIILLLLLMAIPITRSVLGKISEMLSVLGDFVIWSQLTTNDIQTTIILLIIGLSLTYFTLILIVDIFVPIGRILGRLMNNHSDAIWAYSVNIFGSVLGTWTFVLLSFFSQPPFVWFLFAGVFWAGFILWSKPGRNINFALLVTAVILSWFAGRVPGSFKEIWSPYQKLTVKASSVDEIGEYVINVNNIGYQEIINLSDDHVSANPGIFSPELIGFSQYDLPLLFHPNPKSVLLVGTGSGNDVAGALRHNVLTITAVEIDPAIILIGRELHPEMPYLSPRVQLVNDDARSFLSTTAQMYDVIAFGLLDSHTTTSMTNARLDHYVYTKESILQAKSRLNEGGIIVLNFYARRPFIVSRIQKVLSEVFNHPPLILRIPYSPYGRGGVMFVTGDLRNVQKQLDQNVPLANYIGQLQDNQSTQLSNTIKITTDDWPYLYLEAPKIPTLYYLLTGLMVLVFIRSSRKWDASINVSFTNRPFWHFFFLGSAFLLLEVQNISKASVVLGNTWQVNAVIITSVLGMALIANWIAYKFPKLPLAPVYILLIATCLGLYFVDLARFAFLPYSLKAAIVGGLTSLPMLFSGIVFIRSFTVTDNKSNALGANLIGALIGALLQSVTFVTGIKALLIIVAIFYILAVLTRPRTGKESLVTQT